jgi:Competence protein CoiA-like family
VQRGQLPVVGSALNVGSGCDSEQMPLYARVGDHRERVCEDGPSRGVCVDCGGIMIAHRGTMRIWHWAHEAANPNCEAGRESEWHLAWKMLALDGTQEVEVGRRRADVLAPGGYAVELQRSQMNAEEVHGREDDWSAQGGMVWIFCATKEAEKRISWRRVRAWEDRRVLQVTWKYAPDRVRSARAPSFLDLGNERLLFVGRWRLRHNGPLTGYCWPVSKEWVVENVLRGDKIPEPLGEDPEVIMARRARERKAELKRLAAERAVQQAAERERAEAARRRAAEQGRQRQDDIEHLEWLEGVRRYCAASEAVQGFVIFRWSRWLRQPGSSAPATGQSEPPQAESSTSMTRGSLNDGTLTPWAFRYQLPAVRSKKPTEVKSR